MHRTSSEQNPTTGEGAMLTPSRQQAKNIPLRRAFGAVIDVNSPPAFHRRTPIRSFADLKLTSPAAASAVSKLALINVASSSVNKPTPATMMTSENENIPLDDADKEKVKKALSAKFASLVDTTNSGSHNKSSPNKRKFNDENEGCDTILGNNSHVNSSSTTTPTKDVDKHRPKRVSTLKKKKDTQLKSEKIEIVEATSETSVIQKTSPTKKCAEEVDICLPSTSRTESAVNLYSAEQQLKWITEKDGQEDLGYYHLLIEQRFKALKEAWAENDQLEAELEELQQENELLEPMFEKIIELKEMLFGDDDEDDDKEDEDEKDQEKEEEATSNKPEESDNQISS